MSKRKTQATPAGVPRSRSKETRRQRREWRELDAYCKYLWNSFSIKNVVIDESPDITDDDFRQAMEPTK